MAEKTTIARPYAQAIFQIAREKGNLAQTAEALQIAGAVVSDSYIHGLIGNPDVPNAKIAEVLIEACGDRASAETGNFLKLLAESGRLVVLAEISELFDEYRAEEEKSVEAEVISATELSESQKQEIAASLKKRVGREVTLQCKTDASLIGGAIIRAGDLVIDGSLTAQLNKLTYALSR